MLVFHGGFSKEQINKLKNNEYVLYRKSSYGLFRIKQKNTFQYYTIDEKSKYKDIIKNIIEQNYENQWIHCFKYLENALYYCEENYNYVVVFDLKEEILEKYIGVCDTKYEGYKIEYRIPRKEINNTNIIDIFKINYFENDIINKLKEKYQENYFLLKEHEEAKKILKKTNKKCKYI